DFSECDLSSSVFENCDLARAIFANSVIEKADFRTSYNFSIDPEINRIKKDKFSSSNVIGLLDKYDIEI
ncbi:pentapeptide repeat-containing protein, partial [bacterium BMS3Abin03]|nr:pentapeptide repeat-containing protein [bacterium BMS3Abin03]